MHTFRTSVRARPERERERERERKDDAIRNHVTSLGSLRSFGGYSRTLPNASATRGDFFSPRAVLPHPDMACKVALNPTRGELIMSQS